jgi:hypothetical protein
VETAVTDLGKRLDQLERFFGREPECPVCQDRPATVVWTDNYESGEPELTTDSRCPHCCSPNSTMRFHVIYTDEGPARGAPRDQDEKEYPA